MSIKVQGNVLTSNIVVGTETLGSIPIRKNVLKFKTLTCPYLNVNGTTSGVLSSRNFKFSGTLNTFNTNGIIVNGSIWTPSPPFFRGYFTINTQTPNLVTSFYDYSQPIGGDYVNVYIDPGTPNTSIFDTVTLKFGDYGTFINIINNLYFQSIAPNTTEGALYNTDVYIASIDLIEHNKPPIYLDFLNFYITLISTNTYSIDISY